MASRFFFFCFFFLLIHACKHDKRHSPSQPQTKNNALSTENKTRQPSLSKKAHDWIDSHWDINTGRGDVRQYFSDGSVIRTCFHCKYPGYTGGLIIGNFGGSGSALYPKRAIRGFRMINIWCAQDESIWDRSEKAEYTYGWSENFQPKDGGKRLAYRRGRIVENNKERLVLQSENQGGCYRVTKVAYTKPGVKWWIIATRITNICKHTINFDFYTGDDPWLGTYKSSDGDVGWTPAGLVRHEKALEKGLFSAGGFYDLGNKELGQKEGKFSNQANFFLLDPATPLPDLSLFANRFAHDKKDINPEKALNNKSLTALNLAWKKKILKPNEGLTIAMAMGLAQTSDPGSIPRLPKITPEDWSIWRQYLKEGFVDKNSLLAEFAAEKIMIKLSPSEMDLAGTYYVRNRSQSSTSIRISYPIDNDKHRPAPQTIDVDGKRLKVGSLIKNQYRGSTFPIHINKRSIKRFVIRYKQKHSQRKAVYMVTSARKWPTPITRAIFEIHAPLSMGKLQTSFTPSYREMKGQTQVLTIVKDNFYPKKELVITW